MLPVSSSSLSSSSIAFHALSNSRKLLIQATLNQTPSPAVSITGNDHTPPESYSSETNFDANVAMILAVLLCALICALGLNSIIRCALRCSSRIAFESREQEAARLANTGVKRKALKSFPPLTYSASLKLPGLDAECVICLSEFVAGERVRVLPKCNHGFHVRCIDKWLVSHSSCPTCRHCLLNTSKKIVAGNETPPPASHLVPLEPEAPMVNYRVIC